MNIYWRRQGNLFSDLVPEKILIISLKLLGDLIVQTPVFAALRRAFPQAKIVVLCDARFTDALATNDDIDAVWGVPFAEAKRARGVVKLWRKIALFVTWAYRIRVSGFSRVVLMDCNDRACVWAFLSGAKVRAGLAEQKLTFLLNRTLAAREGSTDYIEFYLRIAELVGATDFSRQTKFPLPKNFTQPVTGKYIAIHPGASLATKRWSTENWVLLIERIARIQKTLRFVLLCGPGEKYLCEEIYAALRSEALKRRMILFTERPLVETATAMAAAEVVFALDSAARHLAAAVGTPTIALVAQWILPTWGLYSTDDLQFALAANVPRDAYDITSISAAEVARLYFKRRRLFVKHQTKRALANARLRAARPRRR